MHLRPEMHVLWQLFMNTTIARDKFNVKPHPTPNQNFNPYPVLNQTLYNNPHSDFVSAEIIIEAIVAGANIGSSNFYTHVCLDVGVGPAVY